MNTNSQLLKRHHARRLNRNQRGTSLLHLTTFTVLGGFHIAFARANLPFSRQVGAISVMKKSQY